MKTITFAKRNMLEMFRDPIMYIFSIGFPVIMLVLFQIINTGIKVPEFTFYDINNIMPGVIVFGYYFITLNCALLVSKDKSTSFLTRLLASPLNNSDFVIGYSLPLLLISTLQTFVSFIVALIIGAIVGISFDFGYMLLALVMLLPVVITCIGFGILIGSLLNEKSAPAISSVVINIAALLGGAWFDINTIGGAFQKFCAVLPFYQSVELSRRVINGNLSDVIIPFVICLAYAIVIYGLGIFFFRKKMKNK